MQEPSAEPQGRRDRSNDDPFLRYARRFDRPIVTEILARVPFYPAEEYHQKYYLKNPGEFEAYHVGSGRVGYLEKVWGRK